MSKKSKAGGGHVNLHKVSKKFDCAPGQVSFFTKKDPFNPENELSGYICRAEGKMGGSLFLTEVNGNKLNPEILIYGTPKLAYPYKDFESYELIVPICDKVFFSNKWNGMNVLVYKYKNAEGKVFLSCKSKGTPFLSNTPFGNFLDLAREAFGLSVKKTLTTAHKLLTILARDDVQSKTFELCGQKEPHLVKYDFDLELKPLFHTFTDGSIAPSIGELKETDFGPINYDTDKIVQICKEYQTNDLEANEAFRKANNLQAKYERGHFIREGRVMYCLNDKGRLIDRTMYKVKPKDIEEVHWSNFDVTMQGRVREAFEKIIEREKPVNAQSFKEELDMGPKEWDRFGQDILKYVESLPKGGLPSVKDDKRHVIMLIGIYGSGKSHVAKRIKENINCIVFDGDKAKPSALEKLREAKNNVTVVIDTCNVNPRKRKEFVSEIQKLGILESDAVVVNTKPEICKERLIAAKNVENIQSGDFDAQIKTFRKPTPAEGFKHVHVINDNNEDELKNVLKALAENTKNNNNNNNQ